MLLNFVDGFRDTCNYRCVVMCVFVIDLTYAFISVHVYLK